MIGRSAPIAVQIADWAHAQSAETVPAGALHGARRLLLDRMGIAIAGHHLRPTQPATALATLTPGSPAATIWGSGDSAFAPYAALANGCASEQLELASGPDCVEAAVAVGEGPESSLGEVLLAIAVGAEVGAYFRSWLGEAVERNGLHPPALLGALSSAIAAGTLLRLRVEELAGALSGAACLLPQAPFASFSAGATGKVLYGGWPAMLGVWSALWAQSGTIGATTSLEGSRGIAQALLHAGQAVQPPAFQPPAESWEVERIQFKPFPCSRSSHPALTALETLGPLNAEAIERIEVQTYPYAVELAQRVRGNAPIAEQMRLSTTLALHVVDGRLRPGHSFTPERLADPRIRALANRVSVSTAPEFETAGARVRGARVRVVFSDGSLRLAIAREPRWGPSALATDVELLARHHDLIAAAPRVRRPRLDIMASPMTTPIRAILARPV
ncbi:MAG: MmgE/PrpD family protein [Chloroflexota bacterium]